MSIRSIGSMQHSLGSTYALMPKSVTDTTGHNRREPHDSNVRKSGHGSTINSIANTTFIVSGIGALVTATLGITHVLSRDTMVIPLMAMMGLGMASMITGVATQSD